MSAGEQGNPDRRTLLAAVQILRDARELVAQGWTQGPMVVDHDAERGVVNDGS